MFIKPSQKLKRVLRVYLTYEAKEGEDMLRIYGHLHPLPNKDVGTVGVPKFTSFFKQLSFSWVGEAQPFEIV